MPYMDGRLAAAPRAINPDDTTGYKYIDIVNNGMPAYFADMSEASTAMLRGFLSYEDPKTYEQIFAGITSVQLAMVTGEHDNEFIRDMKSELASLNLTTEPASIPNNPGVGTPDIEFNATLPDGKQVKIVAMLADNIRTGLLNPTFRQRYESLSTRADFITYNGHAGLGSNIRALARAGKWVAGQYVVVFMNGCDTMAYIDGSLSDAHKAINPDDTTGYKYIDIVNNALPAYFSDMSEASLAYIRGFLSYNEPQTYEQIMRSVASAQLNMVTGEHDNVFTPGGGGTPEAWAGLDESGSVARNEKKSYTTPTLAEGTYEFQLTGSGDADLYVRVGREPTLSQYDCRPYKSGSNESCRVTLSQPTTIGVMVNGYAASSTFKLVGKKI